LKHFQPQQKLLLITLALIQFTHIVDFMIMMPLGPVIMAEFKISPERFSWLVSSYTFSAAVSGLSFSFFVDRFDRRKVLLLLFFGFGVGTLLCGLSQGYLQLLTARVFTGFFGGILGSVVLSIVSDAIEPKLRATAMGIVMTAFAMASIIGVPISLYIASLWGWHMPFIILAGFLSLVFFLSWHAVPPLSSHLRGVHRDGPLQILTYIFSDRNRCLALSLGFFLILGHFTIIPFLSDSFVANHGLPQTQLPFVYLVGGCASILTAPLVGRLADRQGKHRIFYIGALLSIGPIVMLTVLPSLPLPLLFVAIPCFFALAGARMIPAQALISTTVEPRFRGAFMSYLSALQNLGSAVAATIAGKLVYRGAEGQLMGFESAGAVAVLFTLLAIGVATKVEDKQL
jgi:MFS transporter, DHA1 family, inner membrane transport protein